MNEELFEKEYKKLNSAQKEAVNTIEGPVMVVAGPGTGKTQILTLRIANILKNTQIDPENILALTFTESGVSSMRKRLSSMIGSEAYRVEISTFHSFANDIILNNPEYFPNIIGSSAITDVEQINHIQDIILESKLDLLKPFGDNFYYVLSIMQSIKKLKREGLSPEEFDFIVKEEKEQFEKIEDLHHSKGPHEGKMKDKYKKIERQILKNEELVLVYKKYQEKIQKNRLYDFEDMIVETLKALKSHEDLLLSLQEQFQYVLVDEHQDTNNAQNKILELLLNFHENPNVFVVGDEKQAIFRFQGASLENFYYFKHLYKNAKLITLTDNYRSTQRILDSAHSLIESENSLSAKGKLADQPIKITSLESSTKEMQYVALEIKKLIKGGISPNEIAVLYRDNKDAFDIAPVLEKENIEYSIESDQSVFEEPVVKKLLTILNAVWNIDKNEYLAKALHLDIFNIKTLDALKLINSSSLKRKKLLIDIVGSEKDLKELLLEDQKSIRAFNEQILDWVKKSKNEDLVRVVSDIMHESGIVKLAISSGIDSALSSLEVLFDEVKTLSSRNSEATLGDFLNYVSLIKEHNLLLKKRSQAILNNKVRLMTSHRSKGLEFEHVFIIHAHQGHFGGRKKREKLALLPRVYSLIEKNVDIDQSDDERNLFYVSLTRAKKGIVITYSKQSNDGKEQLPSPFIHDLREDLVTSEDLSLDISLEDEIPAVIPKNQMTISKEFVRNLFVKQGLSVTALNNYLKSPWQYFYQNLIRIPKTPNKHQSYGIAVHSTLRKLFDDLKMGKDISKKEMLAQFEIDLNAQWFLEHDQNEAKEKGIRALTSWFDSYHETWNTNTLNEFRINGVTLDEDVRLVGVLDKLEFLNEQEVNVVDYKTGKAKTRNQILGKTKDSSGDYHRQLIFYKLLLNSFGEGKYNFVSGEIDFIEPDDKGKMHKERFEVSDDDVLDLREQILQISDEIMNLKFLDKPCDPENCDYCDLVDLIQ